MYVHIRSISKYQLYFPRIAPSRFELSLVYRFFASYVVSERNSYLWCKRKECRNSSKFVKEGVEVKF